MKCKQTIQKDLNIFITHYRDLSELCRKYIDNISNIKVNRIEEFLFICLDSLKSETIAISTLAEKNLYNQMISLIRNIIEIFFNIFWIHNTDESERIEVINKLEGTPYFWHNKEVDYIKGDTQTEQPEWSPEYVKRMEMLLESSKKKHPYLIDKKNKFKSAPPIPDRISKKVRLKYYHIYRFASLFAHPSPFFKELYSKKHREHSDPLDDMGEIFLSMFTYGIWMTYLCYSGSNELLTDPKFTNTTERNNIVASMEKLFNSVNKNYIQLSS